jgi:periplasmic protein TonB
MTPTRAYRSEPGNRALHYAVLFSLVFHGLLLFFFPSLRDSAKRTLSPPLVAHLVQPRPAPAPVPLSEPQVKPPRDAPPPRSLRPVPKLAPIPKLERPAPAPVQQEARIQEPAPPEPARTVPAEPQPPAAVARTEPSTPGAPAASAEPPLAGSLAQYRLQLITMAKRYKRYPRVAIDNNWEGVAEIRMIVGADGLIASLIVRKGSGYEVLDQEALQWIRKAKPMTPIPAALRGKEFTVDIPVIFNLKEPESG